MGTVETFDHTADVGLIVTADTLDDLFQTAAGGMFDYIVVNRGDVRASETEAVSLSSGSLDDLLVLWLNELIFRCETTHRLYSRFEVRVSGLSLRATLFGEAIDRDRHILDHEVKAVTHHGLTLAEENGGYAARFILDI